MINLTDMEIHEIVNVTKFEDGVAGLIISRALHSDSEFQSNVSRCLTVNPRYPVTQDLCVDADL